MTMGFFKDTSHKHSHIDSSTGRNKRDKSTVRGSGMIRHDGKVINRAAQRRNQRTGREEPGTRRWW